MRFISNEAFFIVLVTGGFSMKTAIFHNMLMKERVYSLLQVQTCSLAEPKSYTKPAVNLSHTDQ
jgi:hypothetical protein